MDSPKLNGDAVSAPSILAPELDTINDELKSQPQWVAWKMGLSPTGKMTKLPFNARTKQFADSTDPSTWSTFDQAVKAYDTGKFDGVGFVFSSSDDYAGLDLDNCRNPVTGDIAPWATNILDSLQTYCEVSPSGTGIKAFCKALHPGEGFRKATKYLGAPIAIEMYDAGRYFTTTGYRLTDYPAEIHARQSEYDQIHSKAFPPKSAKKPSERKPVNPSVMSMSDSELIDKAKSSKAGGQFSALWEGSTGSASASEADLSLCNYLRFWTGGDPGRIDSLFRQSGLMRDKWDEKRGLLTYGEKTINVAISSGGDVYDPSYGKSAPHYLNGNGSKPSGQSASQNAPSMAPFDMTEEDSLSLDLLASVDKDFLEGEGKNGPSELTLAIEWSDFARDKFAYVEGDQWYAYNGGRWHYSSLENAQKSVQEFLQKKRANGGKITLNRNKVGGVLFLAKSMLGPHSVSEFDAKPGWIGMANGIFDVTSGELIPHKPEYLLIYQSPFEYVKDATCPRWMQFLDEVLLRKDGTHSTEWAACLQEWFGLTLLPSPTIQAAHYWVGDGSNGKGVATRVLTNLVGAEYCCALPVEQLDQDYHKAQLHGKRVGFVNEPDPRAMKKNASHFKQITGGDLISARRPTEKVFSFVFQGRIILSCNELPSTKDLSAGYFRRVILLEWRNNIPAEKRDKDLDEKLRLELPGIFNWAVEGLMRVRASSKLTIAEESTALLEGYKRNEDPFGRFFEDSCHKDLEGDCQVSHVYNSYKKWCHANGEFMLSSYKIVARLEKMGFERFVKRIKELGGNTWHSSKSWRGFTLSQEQEEFDLE